MPTKRTAIVDEQVLLEFTSHISGRNAKVRVFVDRIEWDRPRGLSVGKLTTGVMTAGISLAVSAAQKGRGSSTEMIPVKALSSVTTARDGMLNTKVVLIASGNTIDMRVGHGEAKEIKQVLTQLILGSHPAQLQGAIPPQSGATPTAAQWAAQTPATPVLPSQPSIGDRLNQLDSLKKQGILTDQEYSAKRTAILAEL